LDQDVDFILGLYLYDVSEEEEMSARSYLPAGRTRMRKVPKPYSLYYMLFINASSQMGLKANDIQKIIGRAAQVLNDANVLLPRQIQPWLETDEPPMLLSPAPLTLDEKMRIWTALTKPYQIGLFYRVAPVLLSSEIIIDTPRVTQAQFNINDRFGKENVP
jgi:hypothetical protein